MSATDLINTVSDTAESLVERIDTDRVAAVVSDIAVGELIAAAMPTVDAASEQIARTARVSWRLRRQLLLATLLVVTLGVGVVVVRRRRKNRSSGAEETDRSSVISEARAG